MNKIIMALVGVALTGVGVNANAVVVTSSTNLMPSLTITSGCNVSVSSNVAFPIQMLTFSGHVISPIATVLVDGGCKKYNLGADAGSHYTAGVRQLMSGGNKIAYILNLSGTGTVTNWGNADMPTTPVNPTASGQNSYYRNSNSGGNITDIYTVTGDATVPSTPVAGIYTDVVAVSIEF